MLRTRLHRAALHLRLRLKVRALGRAQRDGRPARICAARTAVDNLLDTYPRRCP
jgi:hypothetical protein